MSTLKQTSYWNRLVGRKLSEKTKEKMRGKRKGGWKMPDEIRKKLSEIKMGTKMPEKT